MEKEDRKILQHMSNTLDEVLVVMKKPGNQIMKVLEIGATITGVLAILGIVDIIRNWFFGG